MATPRYAWYGYVNRILDKRTKNKSRKETEAVNKALEAADPETRGIIQAVLINRSKDLRGAADNCHISYFTAFNRVRAFRLEVARNLGLLEE